MSRKMTIGLALIVMAAFPLPGKLDGASTAFARGAKAKHAKAAKARHASKKHTTRHATARRTKKTTRSNNGNARATLQKLDNQIDSALARLPRRHHRHHHHHRGGGSGGVLQALDNQIDSALARLPRRHHHGHRANLLTELALLDREIDRSLQKKPSPRKNGGATKKK